LAKISAQENLSLLMVSSARHGKRIYISMPTTPQCLLFVLDADADADAAAAAH
jgi:hypothetical protein